jgi:hypothetical protein
MGEWLERRQWWIGAAVLGTVAVLVIVSVLTGGQARTIVSTVGASVGNAGPAPAEPGPASEPTSAPPDGGPQVASADALAPAPGLLIVHTGKLRLRVDALEGGIDRVTSIVVDAGGYVAASQTSGTGAGATASLDLRIPAAAWDRALTAVRGLGAVLDQQIGSDEVTGQVIDLDARITNLRATEAALQAVMAKATKIPDILEVQEQLTQTRGEIEELTAKATELRDRAAFGSLTVQLSLPAPAPTPTAAPSRAPLWDPGRDAQLAGEQVVRIGQLGTTAAIWIAIVGIPIIVAIALGLGIVRLAWIGARRLRWIARRAPA